MDPDTETTEFFVNAFFPNGAVQRLISAHEALADGAALVVLESPMTKPHIKNVPVDFQRLDFPFGEGEVTILSRGFHFFPKPKPSLSATSGALYLGRSIEKARGWLLQLLPPDVRTSRHYHECKEERFINLAGSCVLGLGDREIDATSLDIVVKPLRVHYLRTSAQPALNVLIITGHPDPLSLADHHYVPFPS